MKILVLYEELAWYFVNCLNEVAAAGTSEILVFCRKANNVAPFEFSYVHPSIRIVDRDAVTPSQMQAEAVKFGPDGIFVGGWAYKPYLQLIKKIKPKVTAIGFDNRWNGSLRQRAGALYFSLTLKKHIQKAFVPGREQQAFARQLGFADKDITQGAYCCDHRLFNSYYEATRSAKETSFPKRFLYVGRYAREKGILDLWSAFITWQNEKPNEWELYCLGKGDVVPPLHEKIKHLGFVQPEKMQDIIAQTGVFILPSTFEPWGVVVQEYAAAGYPLLCSDKIGAAGAFLKEGANGFSFEAGNQDQLKEKINKFSTLNQQELTAMASQSAALATCITPAAWAQHFLNLFAV